LSGRGILPASIQCLDANAVYRQVSEALI
jgi:hypothetical protein